MVVVSQHTHDSWHVGQLPAQTKKPVRSSKSASPTMGSSLWPHLQRRPSHESIPPLRQPHVEQNGCNGLRVSLRTVYGLTLGASFIVRNLQPRKWHLAVV